MTPLNSLCRLAVVCTGWLLLANTTFAQRGPAVIEVTAAEERELLPKQSMVGTVSPTRTAVIGSAVDGRVTEMLVREGDRVEQDQKLASLLTETFQLELKAAKAELELKKQELAELENGSRDEEIAQTSARLEASRVAAEYLEKDRARVAALAASSAISASEFEKSISLALEAQQRFAEAKAAHELAVAGPRQERIDQARAEVDMRKAIAKRLSDQIKKHTLYSRFAGYITVEHTEVGQWLARGEPVAEIIAIDEVDVVVKVLETYIPFLHVGDQASIGIPALPGEKFEGTVSAVIPQADVQSRTFPVKILVKNRFNKAGEPLIKAGMFAHAELPIAKRHKAVVVPKNALVLSGNSTIVWAIDSKSIENVPGNMQLANAMAVRVSTGDADGEWIEVVGDIQAGTIVAVRGNERIPPSRPGQPPSQVTWSNTPKQ